ncbi:hypothetical protein GCM10007860_30720 [Chitiniphilus shinanonensis]|uniref:Uncharacterized protein n=1 Tax=Chitiniphilus shinanonensis TaxID=553088 RepID=A0ABQ6BV99_9NEIS|nr:hypothetical protein [Chitiniphilus shinanonensis]GLS05910.1 hypothetical protein GCM10007860_30720 [Chitiniphilus shinanonensis]
MTLLQAMVGGMLAASLAGVVLAADEAAVAEATAILAPTPVIHRGEPGQTPVEVAYRYLKDRVADEYGVADYRELRIAQQSKGEDFKHVGLEVQMKGLTDDSVATQRFQFKLAFDDAAHAWVIDHARQDWQCRRGGKGWTQRPCK